MRVTAPDFEAIPAWAAPVVCGDWCMGEGGAWLPAVVEVGPGRFCASVGKAGGRHPVMQAAPIWTCPDIALAAAKCLAQIAAD